MLNMLQQVRKFRWLLWDFSGIRSICYKIKPPIEPNERPHATFFLWFAGFYVALFDIASCMSVIFMAL